jgi:hypothetical protein
MASFVDLLLIMSCLLAGFVLATPPRPIIPSQFESDVVMNMDFGDFIQTFPGKEYSDSINSRVALYVFEVTQIENL